MTKGLVSLLVLVVAQAFLGAVNLAAQVLTASPNPIPVALGTLYGQTTISFDAPGYTDLQVRVGSPTGALFASASVSLSKKTGDRVYDGEVFYLVDASTGDVLDTVTVNLTPPILTAFPNPIPVSAGTVYGATTISFGAGGYNNLQIRVGSPTGALFDAGAVTGSKATGNWVFDGEQFFLVDANTGNILDAMTVSLSSAVMKASPNPIPVSPYAVYGTTTISFGASGYNNLQVRVGSPTGALFGAEAVTGSATTGNLVTDGEQFYLIDANTGDTLDVLTAHTAVVNNVPTDPDEVGTPSEFYSLESSGATGCGSIAGSWIEDSGPQAAWSLTQSGNTISGAKSVSYATSCGTITWSVSGETTGRDGVFSVIAAHPTPTVDSCGNTALTRVTETVTISRAECSQGTADLSSPDGQFTTTSTDPGPPPSQVPAKLWLSSPPLN